MNRIALVSLGCPKNLVDSEYICQRLLAAGYPLESDPGKADTIVVNTCAFLTESVEESIQTLLGYLQEGKEVVCTGCLVSRYGRELLDELPEVRLFAGPGTYDRLVDALQSDARYVAPEFTGVVKRSYTTTGASAYVKVSEGCSNNCSYCLIPSLRGGLVSKPPRDIIDECRDLAASGVKEIILVAQDLGGYGRDHEGYPHLSSLLKDISRIEDIQWIRLMYMHPASLDEPLVTAMRDNPKVVPYLDLPIQHVSETVLKAMGRRGGPMRSARPFACWMISTRTSGSGRPSWWGIPAKTSRPSASSKSSSSPDASITWGCSPTRRKRAPGVPRSSERSRRR
ncbi:MAG TPA: radical SAM protein [Deltaproteobacteria bacterium]|nr:radical SAM protein [Deltaproteobacteria bacterium]